jgi:hypothetical protein
MKICVGEIRMMKLGTSALTRFALLVLGLLCFLSGCAMEYNTSARSGAAAGLAVHHAKFEPSPEPYMRANEYLTTEGQNFFRIDAGIPRDNRYFRENQFMDNCMHRCGQDADRPGYDQKFCHSYCACVSEEFRNNIPMQHLMAFGMSSPNASQNEINHVIGICARESLHRKHQPSRAELLPGGQPQSNTQSAPMDARSRSY